MADGRPTQSCATERGRKGRDDSEDLAATSASPVAAGGGKADAVSLTDDHMLPVARTGQVMDDFFGLPMSDGTIQAAKKEAAATFAPRTALIATALIDHTWQRCANKGPTSTNPSYLPLKAKPISRNSRDLDRVPE